jgi:putative transposase
MKRFKSAGQAQRFLSAFDGINKLCHPCRDHLTADQHQAARIRAFETWAGVTACVSVA